MKTYKKQCSSGFSLVEVLVSTVIIAVGLLGLISLQLTEMKSAKHALDGSKAAIYITDMGERIRANSGQSASYIVAHGIVPSVIDCVANTCNAVEMAQFDIYTWQNMIKNNLPSGGGSLTQAAGDITITIRWDADLSGSSGKNCPVTSSADLDCLQVVL